MTTKAEKQEAIDRLRGLCPPGSTIYTVLRSVSRSGMSRRIDVYALQDNEPRYLTGLVSKACDIPFPRKGEGLQVGGGGMDMGFHVVEAVSYALWGSGYPCLGKGKCPSNYHVNHRDSIRCEGIAAGPGGRRQYCYAPSRWRADPIPEGWPMLPPVTVTPDDGEPVEISRGPAHCITEDADGNELVTPVVCPTCKGEGYVPNPEGPERFDLTHTDGYALRHRWM